MLSSALPKSLPKTWLAALVAFAAVLLPVLPAKAAVTTEVAIPLTSGGVRLGGVYGTLTWESATTFSYSIDICRESSYVPVTANPYINGGYSDFLFLNDGTSVRIPQCIGINVRKTGTVQHGSTVFNVRIRAHSVYFNPSTGQPIDRDREFTYNNPLA